MRFDKHGKKHHTHKKPIPININKIIIFLPNNFNEKFYKEKPNLCLMY